MTHSDGHPAARRPQDRWIQAELPIPGATLVYRQSGDGPDVVWLAAGDNPGDNWRRYQTPAFDDAYRSTTYDARGVGATTSDSDAPWSIADHAADLARLLEAVCRPPVVLVGLSMGSLIAVQIAHDRPELVRSAIVIPTPDHAMPNSAASSTISTKPRTPDAICPPISR